MKRNRQKYQLDFLLQHFFIGKDTSGHWRVFHKNDRGLQYKGGRRIKAGDIADGPITNKGYRLCTLPQVDNVRKSPVLAHIVMWVIFNGRDVPDDFDIDHENRNKLDNDPEKNLRLLAHRSNTLNCSRYAKNSLNVEIHRRKPEGTKRFVARAVDPTTGKRKSLGIYLTMAEAQVAADTFIVDRYGSNAPTNRSLGLL